MDTGLSRMHGLIAVCLKIGVCDRQGPSLPVKSISLEHSKETSDDGVVVALPASTHSGEDGVLLERAPSGCSNGMQRTAAFASASSSNRQRTKPQCFLRRALGSA